MYSREGNDLVMTLRQSRGHPRFATIDVPMIDVAYGHEVKVPGVPLRLLKSRAVGSEDLEGDGDLIARLSIQVPEAQPRTQARGTHGAR